MQMKRYFVLHVFQALILNVFSNYKTRTLQPLYVSYVPYGTQLFDTGSTGFLTLSGGLWGICSPTNKPHLWERGWKKISLDAKRSVRLEHAHLHCKKTVDDATAPITL